MAQKKVGPWLLTVNLVQAHAYDSRSKVVYTTDVARVPEYGGKFSYRIGSTPHPAYASWDKIPMYVKEEVRKMLKAESTN